MNRRISYLLALLAAVLVGSLWLSRAAATPVNAVPVNGTNFTRLSTDVCAAASPSPTCLRANTAGDLVERHNADTWHVVAVSPSPSTSAQVPSWNQTDRKWYLSSGGGAT